MGGNSPSHFSEEEGGGITLVKGIRGALLTLIENLSFHQLSDGVINRMKRSSEVNSHHIPAEPQTPAPSPLPVQSVEHLPTPPAPPQKATPPPPVEPAPPVKHIPPPPPVKFHSLPSASVESEEQTCPLVSPPPSSTLPPETETPAVPESVPSPPGGRSDISPSATTCEPAAESALDDAVARPPKTPTPPAETAASSSGAEDVPPAVDAESPPPRPELAAATDLSSAVAASCWREKLSPVPSAAPVNEPNITCSPPAEEETPPGAAVLPVCPESVEEELRQKIKVEMRRSLEEELNQKRQNLQQQLEELRLQAQAEARVEQQVNRTLKEELTESTMEEEKMKAEDEELMVQLYWMELKAHQLEDKENQMKQRDVLHKEHLAKRETKFSEFYKVSVENFQKGKEEAHRRFARFNCQPVCGHLQAQVLKCYKENPGKTLNCSGIASAYMQCVDNAKKVHITP